VCVHIRKGGKGRGLVEAKVALLAGLPLVEAVADQENADDGKSEEHAAEEESCHVRELYAHTLSVAVLVPLAETTVTPAAIIRSALLLAALVRCANRRARGKGVAAGGKKKELMTPPVALAKGAPVLVFALIALVDIIAVALGAQSTLLKLRGDVGQLHAGPLSVAPSTQLVLGTVKAADVVIARAGLPGVGAGAGKRLARAPKDGEGVISAPLAVGLLNAGLAARISSAILAGSGVVEPGVVANAKGTRSRARD